LIGNNNEEYILNWETELLIELNKELESSLLEYVKKVFTELVYKELEGNLYAACVPVIGFGIKKAFELPDMLLSKLKSIDGTWERCLDRARQTGILLAETLYQTRQTGVDRPVVLVGYGMGARVIFECLLHLYELQIAYENNEKQKQKQPQQQQQEQEQELQGEQKKNGSSNDSCLVPANDIILHVVLMGGPIGFDYHQWMNARSIVTHRFVNCYATEDWMLALYYRLKNHTYQVAGLHPIVLTAEQPVTEDEQSTVQQETIKEKKILPQQQLEFKQLHIAQNQRNDIENIDVTSLIKVHADYTAYLYDILELVNLK
jgi:hypothetical protein